MLFQLYIIYIYCIWIQYLLNPVLTYIGKKIHNLSLKHSPYANITLASSKTRSIHTLDGLQKIQVHMLPSMSPDSGIASLLPLLSSSFGFSFSQKQNAILDEKHII